MRTFHSCIKLCKIIILNSDAWTNRSQPVAKEDLVVPPIYQERVSRNANLLCTKYRETGQRSGKEWWLVTFRLWPCLLAVLGKFGPCYIFSLYHCSSYIWSVHAWQDWYSIIWSKKSGPINGVLWSGRGKTKSSLKNRMAPKNLLLELTQILNT